MESQNLYWECFKNVEKGEALQKVYDSVPKPITDENVAEFLTKASSSLGCDISGAKESFSKWTNLNDPLDVVCIKDISFDELKRRLGNWVLERVYSESKEKLPLSKFISHARDIYQKNPESTSITSVLKQEVEKLSKTNKEPVKQIPKEPIKQTSKKPEEQKPKPKQRTKESSNSNVEVTMEEAKETACSYSTNPELSYKFWNAFLNINTGNVVEEPFMMKKKPIDESKAGEVVKEIEKVLELDFDFKENIFLKWVNPNDPNDVVNGRDISLLEFKKRLGNSILKTLFDLKTVYYGSTFQFMQEIRGKVGQPVVDKKLVKSLIKELQEKEIKDLMKKKQAKGLEYKAKEVKNLEYQVESTPDPKEKLKTAKNLNEKKKDFEVDKRKVYYVRKFRKSSSQSVEEHYEKSLKQILSNNFEKPRRSVEKKHQEEPITIKAFEKSPRKERSKERITPLRAQSKTKIQPQAENIHSKLKPPKTKHKTPKEGTSYLSKSEPVKNSNWIKPLFKHYESYLAEAFYAFDSNKNQKIQAENLPSVLRDLFKKAQLLIDERSLSRFDSLVSSMFSPSEEVTFEQFCQAAEDWAKSYNKVKNRIINIIEKSIEEFKSILSSYNYHDQSIQDTVDQMQNYLNVIAEKKAKEIEKNIDIETLKAVDEIFMFYAKSSTMVGKKPTFEALKDNNETWSISKFMKFCSDFSITRKNWAKERLLSSEELSEIFKRTATYSRYMSKNEFISALDKIADNFFNETYDQLYQTKYSCLPVVHKRSLFYAFLEINSKEGYKKKMKGFGIPFGNFKDDERIPKDESSHKYSFRLSPQKKRQLNEWREKNYSSSPVRPNEKELNKANSSKRIRTPSVPKSGYARRLLAKKTAQSNHNNSAAEPSVKETESHEGGTPLYFKNLSELQVNKEEMDDFLHQEEDEQVQKFYGSLSTQRYSQNSNTRLKAVMQMHDEKYNKGLKVIQKAKNGFNKYL